MSGDRILHGIESTADLRALPREQVEQAALADDNVQRAIDGAAVKRVIVVPGKLVNLVV